MSEEAARRFLDACLWYDGMIAAVCVASAIPTLAYGIGVGPIGILWPWAPDSRQAGVAGLLFGVAALLAAVGLWAKRAWALRAAAAFEWLSAMAVVSFATWTTYVFWRVSRTHPEVLAEYEKAIVVVAPTAAALGAWTIWRCIRSARLLHTPVVRAVFATPR